MIGLKFYRDDNYVYYNNPNGITRKMTIADFEAMMSNESELPAYTSSSQGKVLSVDSEGDLEWANLPTGGGTMRVIYDGSSLDKTFKQITDALSSDKFVYVYYHVETNDGVSHFVWYVFDAYTDNNEGYVVLCSSGGETLTFTSETEDGVLEVASS